MFQSSSHTSPTASTTYFSASTSPSTPFPDSSSAAFDAYSTDADTTTEGCTSTSETDSTTNRSDGETLDAEPSRLDAPYDLEDEVGTSFQRLLCAFEEYDDVLGRIKIPQARDERVRVRALIKKVKKKKAEEEALSLELKSLRQSKLLFNDKLDEIFPERADLESAKLPNPSTSVCASKMSTYKSTSSGHSERSKGVLPQWKHATVSPAHGDLDWQRDIYLEIAQRLAGGTLFKVKGDIL